MKRSELIFSLAQIPFDFIMVILAGIAAYLLRLSQFMIELRPALFFLPFSQYLTYLAIGGGISVLFFALAGLYQLKITRSLIRELFLVIVALTAGVVAIAFYFFLAANPFESRFIVLAWWFFAIILVSIGRILLKKIQQFLTSHYGIGVHNVLLIGHPNPGRSKEFLSTLRKNPGLGFRVVTQTLDINLKYIAQVIKNKEVDDVFLTDLSYDNKKILELADFSHRMQLNFSFIPSEFGSFQTQLKTFPSGLAILEVKHTPLEGWGKIIKRAIDTVGSIGIAIAMAPLFIVIAIAIKLNSAGPILVKLKRVREGEEVFFLYKFRSMLAGTHELRYTTLKDKNIRKDGPLIKIKDDPRITKVGIIIRRFHLDEFAQIINVIKGEMSLVGPRPHEPEEVAHYRKHHMKLLSIKPGITGLSQISGASRLQFEREVELDTYYIRHWSLALDMYILLKTMVVIFMDKEAE